MGPCKKVLEASWNKLFFFKKTADDSIYLLFDLKFIRAFWYNEELLRIRGNEFKKKFVKSQLNFRMGALMAF
jgi:hypothetical protein